MGINRSLHDHGQHDDSTSKGGVQKVHPVHGIYVIYLFSFLVDGGYHKRVLCFTRLANNCTVIYFSSLVTLNRIPCVQSQLCMEEPTSLVHRILWHIMNGTGIPSFRANCLLGRYFANKNVTIMRRSAGCPTFSHPNCKPPIECVNTRTL